MLVGMPLWLTFWLGFQGGGEAAKQYGSGVGLGFPSKKLIDHTEGCALRIFTIAVNGGLRAQAQSL